MGIPENIDALLVKYDINQDCLARIADVAPSAITRWRQGSWPRKKAIEKICEHFGLEEDDILSDSYGLAAKEHMSTSSMPAGARPAVGMPMGLVPRLGRVHAGVLTEPENLEEMGDMVSIPQFLIDSDPSAFVVSSEGDCMDKVFAPGSDLIVSPGKIAQDRSIVLAMIDGRDGIVRRMRRTPRTLLLSPESHNPDHEDIIITDDSGRTVEIVGVVTWFQASKEMD